MVERKLRLGSGIVWTAAAFFYLYALSFRVLPAELYTARVISLAALLLFGAYVVGVRGRLLVNGDVVLVIGAYAAYAAWVTAITLLAGAEDLGLLKNSTLLLLQVFPGAALLAYWASRNGSSMQQVVLSIHLIIFIQALLILAAFLSQDFRTFTLDLLHEAEGNVDPLDPLRVRGLTHSTGAKLSAFQAVGILLSCYLLVHWPRRSLLLGIYIAISTLVLLGSILLTGRTGFLMVPIAIVFMAWHVLASGRVRMAVPVVAILMAFGLFVGLSLLQTLYQLFDGAAVQVSDDAVARVVRRVTKEFNRYIVGGSIDAGTIGVLLHEHWIVPQGAPQLLFGDPKSWGVARISSDIGVVRMIFGAGLVGAALLYAAGVALCAAAIGAARTLADKLLVILLLLWTIVVELKEPYFTDLRNVSLLALLMMFLCLRRTALLEPINRYRLV